MSTPNPRAEQVFAAALEIDGLLLWGVTVEPTGKAQNLPLETESRWPEIATQVEPK